MAELYSGLEVDHSAQSPEVVPVDRSAESPELDKKWRPELSPSTQSQSFSGEKNDHGADAPETGGLDGSFPRSEGINREAEGLKETVPDRKDDPLAATAQEEKGSRRRRGILFWLAIGAGILIVLGVALGVGLGVGLTRNKGSNSSSSSSTGTPATAADLPHGLPNGTAFSVVALTNGDKRLFFQENTGNIREALFTQSSKQWQTNVNDVVATNARNSTPISALFVNTTSADGSAGDGMHTTAAKSSSMTDKIRKIYLFYIANSNQLSSRHFVSGTWTTRDNFSPTVETNATYPTQNGTRALAITTNTNSSIAGAAFVFYVAQNGSAACLSVLPDQNDAIVASPGPTPPDSIQGNHIQGLAAGVSSSNGTVRSQMGVLTSEGTPYYSLFFSFLVNGSWSAPELETVLVPPLPANEITPLPTTLTLDNAYPAASTQTAPLPSSTIPASARTAAYNESLLGDVNIAQVFINTNPSSAGYTLFGFWVNGTSLAAYTTKNIGLNGQPTSPFPFPRLAGTSVGESVYLYHQLNGTGIAEDIYDTHGGFFTSGEFGVKTK